MRKYASSNFYGRYSKESLDVYDNPYMQYSSFLESFETWGLDARDNPLKHVPNLQYSKETIYAIFLRSELFKRVVRESAFLYGGLDF